MSLECMAVAVCLSADLLPAGWGQSIHTLLCCAALRAGAKLEREQVPGVKLKFENKKPIVGLAVHPSGACWAG